jgi:hypothetical protein
LDRLRPYIVAPGCVLIGERYFHGSHHELALTNKDENSGAVRCGA